MSITKIDAARRQLTSKSQRRALKAASRAEKCKDSIYKCQNLIPWVIQLELSQSATSPRAADRMEPMLTKF